MPIFPFAEAQPIQYPGPLPDHTDVVIVGGGIIGVATAFFLAKQKIPVTILEKGRIAAEQSSRNWGWVRQQGRDEAELPIMMEARRLWKMLAEECGEEIGLRETGCTMLARHAQDMNAFANFLKVAEAHGLETRLLDGAEAAAQVPGMARHFKGALTTPSDMRAEPWLAVPAFARLAVRLGVKIVENCAVRTLDVQGGKIAGVETEKGRLRVRSVLVAGGIWSSLLRRHGQRLPQLGVRGTVVATAPLPEFYAGNAVEKHSIAFRRRLDGGYTLAAGTRKLLHLGPEALRHSLKYIPALKLDPLGTSVHPFAPRHYPDAWRTPQHWEADGESPFEKMRVLNPRPVKADLRGIRRQFDRLFPQYGRVPFKCVWGGMIDALPDVVPVLDKLEAIKGLYVATGLCGHGFGIGPGIGRVMADMIVGKRERHDLSRFRFGRFYDGSRLQLGPA